MKPIKLLTTLGLTAAMLTGCSKKAPDAVNDIYASLQKSEIENLIQYAIPDSVGQLTDAEKALFVDELKGDFSKDYNTLLSYEIVKVDVDSAENHAEFEVKTVHNGGTSYTERGTINRNPETGHWTLRLDSVYTENAKEKTKEAMPRLRAAAITALSAKGVPYYMYQNAIMMEENIYGYKDPATSFNLYKKAAEAGYIPAYYRLGNAYSKAYGTDRDYEAALAAYQKGADANDTDCVYELADCYESGRGTAKDYDKVFELAQKLNKLDPTSAYLGYCYDEGIGTAKDPEKAFQLYMKAAEAGSKTAMNNIALCYENGTGVAKDYAEAIKWYNKAIDNGFTLALNNLGWMYMDGKGVDKDPSEALRLWRKGADKNNSWCINSIGVAYRDGKGVSKNLNDARDWFERAMKLGNSAAKNNLNNLWRY